MSAVILLGSIVLSSAVLAVLLLGVARSLDPQPRYKRTVPKVVRR